MNQDLIGFLTVLGIILTPSSSSSTPFIFSDNSYESSQFRLVGQAASTEDIQEEMLIEGMDKGILGDYQGAIDDFTEVIHLYPNSAEAYYNRGIAYTKLGNYEAAMTDYNQSISLNPNLAEAYVDRARVYSHLGNSSEALKDLQRAANIFKQQGNTIAYNQTVKMMQKLQ